MAQLDLRHIFRLRLVDPEADHQVGDNLALLLRLADDLNRLVDIQQDFGKALQQMQLLLALGQVVKGAPAHAFYTEGDPLIEQLFHAEHARHPGDQHIKVAGKRILQRRDAKELLHELLRVYAALEINGQLHTG